MEVSKLWAVAILRLEKKSLIILRNWKVQVLSLLCGGSLLISPCSQDCGRLLYAGQDDWVHVNCALWSAEVYEEVDGTLQNVHGAITRGKQLVSARNLRRCCVPKVVSARSLILELPFASSHHSAQRSFLF